MGMMMRLLVVRLLIVTMFPFQLQGVLILSPSEVVLCPTDQLILTCTSNSTAFLQWEISDPQQMVRSVTRTVANEGTTPPFTFGGTTFYFSLNSTSGTLPHANQIYADSVASGTMISCSELVNQKAINTQRATVCIIGNSCGPVIVAPEVNVTELFESTGVVTLIEWNPENRISYTISIFPEIRAIFIGETTIQLTVPYDVQLTVNVSGTLCLQKRTTSKLIYHAPRVHDSIQRYPSSYINPAREGTIITFTCSASDQILTGPNATTCMSNGVWEPDPIEVACKVDCGIPSVTDDTDIYYSSTLEGSQLVYSIKCKDKNVSSVAVCQENATWLPDPTGYVCSSSNTETVSSELGEHSNMLSIDIAIIIALVSSTSVFALFSAFIFIFGLLCGHYLWKRSTISQSSEERVMEDIQLDGPVYENLTTNAKEHDEKPNLELESNISYGQLPTVTVPK